MDAETITTPNYYAQYAVEPIEFIMKNDMDFWRGNIIKYASRAGQKVYDGMDAKQSEVTDLHKVMRYAEMRINQLQNRNLTTSTIENKCRTSNTIQTEVQ